MIEKKIFESREKWLEARANRIGGSDSASVLGLSPYKSNVRLWELKTGRAKEVDKSDNSFIQYGTAAESHLRELFKLDFPEYQVEYEENNMWLNDKFPFAHASLDGWLIDPDGRKGILEIKTASIMSAVHRERWTNHIPDNYYCQILHYLMITEFDFAIVKAQLKLEFDSELMINTKHYLFERSDVSSDIELMQKAEEKFYKHILTDTRPELILPNI